MKKKIQTSFGDRWNVQNQYGKPERIKREQNFKNKHYTEMSMHLQELLLKTFLVFLFDMIYSLRC